MTLPAMLNESSGEVVRLVTAEHLLQAAGLTDLTAAELEQLAAFTENAEHLAAIAREAKGTVSDELLRRMDRKGRWTVREGEFEVKAPSPQAGTVVYDSEKLLNALIRLAGTSVIDRDALEAAVEMVYPAPYLKQHQAGINALLKLGGAVAAAVEACRVETEPPRRTARVKRKA